MQCFLSFDQSPELRLGNGLTVLTGPNGAGKSNIARSLDLARAVLAPHDDSESERLDLYQDAGFEGATDFTVKLDIDLDQPWEQDLVRLYGHAVYDTHRAGNNPDERLEADANDMAADSFSPLLSGTLVIRRRSGTVRPWSADWEFSHESMEWTWHAVLVGDDGIDQLRPGEAGTSGQVSGGIGFDGWLADGKPETGDLLDFRSAMRSMDRSVDFSARAGQVDRIPVSARELASLLGLEPQNRSFSFRQVIRLILQRGIALTDNRRLPLQRRFPLSALNGPVDLRDGAAVGAEIFRLKNGDTQEKERFREIQAMFRSLSGGRDLDVRARPASVEEGETTLIIEPTITGQHVERPVEFAGAGMQEALVLSTLLRGEPGRVTVLDEPAVNLEPSVQRRLVSQIRGPGQYLVITHSANLVPFDEPDDLKRIVRVTPSAVGSRIRQPNYSAEREKEQFRQLQLIQPTEIRSFLFAEAVVLCEGATEVGALPQWWNNAQSAGLPDLAIANVSFASVDGHNGYAPYIRFLDAYSIPWVIISDGPALRPGQRLAKDVKDLGHWPDGEPDDPQDFQPWRVFWEQAGVFTLATQFGDDGSKGGEFEALLRQVDFELLSKAFRETGKSKPRVGAYFASAHPELPSQIHDLFQKIAGYLQPA